MAAMEKTQALMKMVSHRFRSRRARKQVNLTIATLTRQLKTIDSSIRKAVK